MPAPSHAIVGTTTDNIPRIDRIEELEDIAEARAVNARIAAGIESATPAEIVRAVDVDGVHPVRAWREHRGLTLSELATRVDTYPSALFKIENRQRRGSIGMLRKIAAALDVRLDDVVDPSED